ncbi:hypothetical protein EB796_019717 [Bugula neritina]|uniref:Uncharacterized protein n=1 Tax=Bugula neritina TaxID=10212 RepID=A0A7J7J9C5_BUGNE|nr:hypothetical protein EB796_019717 [Bugula neritina]
MNIKVCATCTTFFLLVYATLVNIMKRLSCMPLFLVTFMVITQMHASAVPCTCSQTVNCFASPCYNAHPCYKANTECVDAYCKGCHYYYKNTVTGQVAYDCPRTCDP